MSSSDIRLKSPSKQFLTFQKSASTWVHLTEWILFLEPTLWGQRLVTAKNKVRNIQSFCFKPGIILSGVAKLGDEIREVTGRSRLCQSHENCSFIRLLVNDAFRKTLLKAAAKKTLRQRAMTMYVVPAWPKQMRYYSYKRFVFSHLKVAHIHSETL